MGAMGGLLAYAADRAQEPSCRVVGDCLGQAITALLLSGLILVVTAVGLVVARFPARDYLLLPLYAGLAYVAGRAVGRAREWYLGFPNEFHFPAVGWWIWVPVMLACLVVSWLAVRQARTPWWLRITAPVLVAALIAATLLAAERAERAQRAAEIAAVPVTYYRPVLPRSKPTQAAAFSGNVHLYYQASEPTSFPGVTLIPAQGRNTCEVVAKATVLGLRDEACTGDEFVSTEDEHTTYGYHAAVLRRGDTVLIAYDRNDGITADELLTALRTAPVSTPAELAAW